MGSTRKWPNQQPVVDGVKPAAEVDQSPDLHTEVDLEKEMEETDVDD